MELNYSEEVNSLEPPLNWWKPQEGKHKVHIVKIGEIFETVYKGESRRRVPIEIEVDGEGFTWGITVIKTINSLYGQLMRAGEFLGSLENKTIDVIVQGKNTSRKYIVEQALENSPKVKKADSPRTEQIQIDEV